MNCFGAFPSKVTAVKQYSGHAVLLYVISTKTITESFVSLTKNNKFLFVTALEGRGKELKMAAYQNSYVISDGILLMQGNANSGYPSMRCPCRESWEMHSSFWAENTTTMMPWGARP